MSLFVGNVSKQVSHRQLESLFKKFGKCRIDLRDRYAFVQFDNDNHGEAAKKQLQHETFHGLELNIQWSKNSGRFGQNNAKRNNGGGGVQRKRSRSRQNKWKRQDRWGRRSPSYQRRSSPSYSANREFEGFVSQSPRDQIILRKLLAKVQQKQSRNRDKRDHQNGKHGSSSAVNQTQVEPKAQNKVNGARIVEQNIKINEQQQQGVVHEDGQIPASK